MGSAAANNCTERFKPCPFPAVWYLEGNLVLNADGFGRMALLVDALLIAAAIGTAEDDGLAALGGFHLLLLDEFATLFADALQQGARGLVSGILRHELTLYGHLKHRLAQTVGQGGVQFLTGVLEPAVSLDQRHELINALDDAVLLSERRTRS